jgi:hypothetical protein
VVAALLLAAPAVVQGGVDLAVTPAVHLRGGVLAIDVAIRNVGDEPAVALTVALHALGRTAEGSRRDRLERGEVWAQTLAVPAGALGPGRWPYILAIAYARRDGYPQHGLHTGTLVVGAPGPPEVAVAALAAEPLGTTSGLRARVENRGLRPRRVVVAVHAPAGVTVDTPTRTVEVGGGDGAWVEFAVINRTEVPWSRPSVHVGVEYDADGVHQSVLAAVALDVVPPLFFLTRRRSMLWTAAALVALVWLAVVLRRVAASGDRTAPASGGQRASTRTQPPSSLPAKAAMPPGRRALRIATDAAAVGAASAVVLALLPWAEVLEPTTPAGGDAASHYYAAVYLRDVLLPRGAVVGWCPGSFAGFPLFQFYFPLPFVLMSLLSLALPLSVAFKLVTLLGPALLPACAYASLRLAGARFPGPALAAPMSLSFLFMEANSMWGGNLSSTLSGEFAYALGLDLALLFVGILGRGLRTRRARAAGAVLLAGIGLCHGYALLWAGGVSAVDALASRAWARRLGALLAVHGMAVLLMGFWLLPLLWYAPWTTSYDPVWPFGSWQEALPPILWPAAVLAVVLGPVAAIVERRRERSDIRVLGTQCLRVLGTLWAAIAVAVVAYRLGPTFGVVDFRFLPFAQVGVCLAAAAALGSLLGRLAAAELWPAVAALTVLPFVHSQVRIVPFQAVYDYSGFEKKAGWPVYQRLSRHLGGGVGDPRVAYEHSPEHVTLGSERALENLPLFSGRSTLDGLYMQSSATAPFVYYVQSELSLESTCPLPDWGCARPDLDRGIAHLRMFNASHFIARSAEVTAMARRHPALTMELAAGEYEVFRLRESDGRYVVPLEVAPVLVRTATWKEAAFRWFKHAEPGAPVPVFGPTPVGSEAAGFAGVFDALPKEPPRRPLPPPPALEERIDVDRISVSGCRPGHPLLIRVSYHPRWRALTGETVFLAGPNLMLVFPRGRELELVFGSGTPILAGRVATAVGGLLVLGAMVPVRWLPLGGALGRTRPVQAVRSAGARLVRWIESAPLARRASAVAGVAGALVLLGLMAVGVSPSPHEVYLQAQERYKAGDLDGALPLFQRAQRGAPLSRFASLGAYFEATVHFQQERWDAARETFARVLAEFPEAITAPAATYHLGLCQARLADLESARRTWQRAQGLYPGTHWANLAAERLRETSGAGTHPPAPSVPTAPATGAP